MDMKIEEKERRTRVIYTGAHSCGGLDTYMGKVCTLSLCVCVCVKWLSGVNLVPPRENLVFLSNLGGPRMQDQSISAESCAFHWLPPSCECAYRYACDWLCVCVCVCVSTCAHASKCVCLLGNENHLFFSFGETKNHGSFL